MLSWKEIVQEYIIKHSDAIQRVTRPLHDHFKIEYFTYHRIDSTGKYTVLVDRPDWAEHYVGEKFYLHDPYLRHPEVYKSGLGSIANHGSVEHRNRVLTFAKEKFHLDLGVFWIEKGIDCVEFFGYSANRESGLEQLTLNQPWVLKSFASHFKKQMRPILKKMEEEAGSLIELKGADYHCKEPIHPEPAPAVLLNYLKDLGKGSEIAKVKKLSAREKQCILLLLAGKGAKETASALKLSHRTVEFYFENIKNKFCCSTKQEVFQMGKELQELGLIPYSLR